MNRLFIVPAFAADECGLVPQVNVPDIPPQEEEYMLKMVYTMYANPLKNKLAAIGE